MSPADLLVWVGSWAWSDFAWMLRELVDQGLQLLVAGGYALVRATGVTVQTGQHGLKYSFGRVAKVVGPGFHPLVPGLQRIEEVPTRARTIDLEAQRLTTSDGLVFDVDTSATWRIVDLAVALVEVDDLEKAMADALAVTVHEVVRTSPASVLADAGALDGRLAEAFADRVAGWGVTVEAAGCSSFSPTPETLRATQLRATVAARRRAVEVLVGRGVPPRKALALACAGPRWRPRGEALRAREVDARWRAAVLTALDEEQERPEADLAAWDRGWREAHAG